jgi:hypothetical protein
VTLLITVVVLSVRVHSSCVIIDRVRRLLSTSTGRGVAARFHFHASGVAGFSSFASTSAAGSGRTDHSIDREKSVLLLSILSHDRLEDWR